MASGKWQVDGTVLRVRREEFARERRVLDAEQRAQLGARVRVRLELGAHQRRHLRERLAQPLLHCLQLTHLAPVVEAVRLCEQLHAVYA